MMSAEHRKHRADRAAGYHAMEMALVSRPEGKRSTPPTRLWKPEFIEQMRIVDRHAGGDLARPYSDTPAIAAMGEFASIAASGRRFLCGVGRQAAADSS